MCIVSNGSYAYFDVAVDLFFGARFGTKNDSSTLYVMTMKMGAVSSQVPMDVLMNTSTNIDFNSHICAILDLCFSRASMNYMLDVGTALPQAIVTNFD